MTDLHLDKVSGEAYVQPRPDHRVWKLRLRELLDAERVAAGCTYAELGAAIGLDADTVADMIAGDHPITLDQVHLICYILGIRLAPPGVDRSGL